MKSGKNHNAGGAETSRVLRAASEQIELALADSQSSVDALGDCLQKLVTLLPADSPNSPPVARELRRQVTEAIRCMQYHDRLTQHLGHVKNYLAEGAAQIEAVSGMPEEPWAGLHRQLAERLLSDTQRFHLGRNFPEAFLAHQRPTQPDRPAQAARGDIELF